jgi:hypothetical protein
MLRVIFLGAGVQVDLRTDAEAGQPDLFNTLNAKECGV